MKRLLTGLILALAAGLAPAADAAWTLSQASLTGAKDVCFDGPLADDGGPDVRVTAASGCKAKTASGVAMAGTKDGIGGEIGGAGENLSFAFGANVFLTALDLAALYPAGEFQETVNEAAIVDIFSDGGLVGSFVLEATGAKTASWSGAGTVDSLSPAQDGKGDGKGAKKGAGLWRVRGDNIFGDGVTFDTLVLSGGGVFGRKKELSEFGFVSLSGGVVPAAAAAAAFAATGGLSSADTAADVSEPGALTVLSLALLAFFHRRRRMAAVPLPAAYAIRPT